MYYVLCKMRGNHGVGCHKMLTKDRSLVDEHAKFLLSKEGIADNVMVLTKQQAQKMCENLTRKLIDELINNHPNY